ncbi:MAG: type IV pilus secretin PilQ [Desulfuromonadales bacterium]|nr:type IV pilus secretin PilQ [Desulfuromonadales bacterium]MDW7756816.1 type IV pilus secretin PilQ [Desulfuromonadales bacterium]
MKRMSFGGLFLGRVSILAVLVSTFVLAGYAGAADSPAKTSTNRLVEIQVQEANGLPVVGLVTEKPVEYRYTVYESFDPVRVVIDFPGMDVSAVSPLTAVNQSPLQEIKASTTELPSGKLGRVELVLSKPSAYDVSLVKERFTLTFRGAAESKPVTATATAAAPAPAVKKAAEPAPKIAVAGKVISAVNVTPGKAAFSLTSGEPSFKYFTLKSPSRLVVDLLGVKPAFTEKSFMAQNGFDKIRVGNYPDKTRFVFDASSAALPDFTVDSEQDKVLVTWTSGEQVKKDSPAPVAAATSASTPVVDASSNAVDVEALDFSAENGQSVFTVSLSHAATVGKPVKKGNIVSFDVKNANISRSLRRVFDASAFPSAVKLITPYTVQEKAGQTVRFAAELKGSVPYELKTEGNQVRFIVQDGRYAEAAPAPLETVSLAVPAQEQAPAVTAVAAPIESGTVSAQDSDASEESPTTLTPVAKPQYTGEKVTLVFDDADIRKILQLIAEVSNQNIIVSEEVKGNISLRLIDVPWDQALDLVLEIKELGMIQEGNVVRVLPKEKIRSMDEAKLTAARTKEQLEDLVTEVISVSYTDLKNVSAPARELLTERGKITEDARNKQIIVSDIASRIAEVRKLVKILDTPEKQVMIEARIVEANSNFGRDLGINWGITYSGDGDPYLDPTLGGLAGGGSFLLPSTVGTPGLGGSIRFGNVGIDSTILDLRLAASETRGQSKVISKPRVTTLNGEEATISQGTQIPYQSISDAGTKTEFVDATLELEVKPIINPDNTVILEIKASNNTPTTVAGATAPAIDKKEAETKLLLKDGETTVLGGIFVENEAYSTQGVPILMHIPVLGHLFKSTNKSNDRRELLVFITPRIISE